MIALGWVAWVAIAVMYVATIVVLADLLADRRNKHHEYRMKRLEYDEQALGDAEGDLPRPVWRCPECGSVATTVPGAVDDEVDP